jgi:hypothetical protein
MYCVGGDKFDASSNSTQSLCTDGHPAIVKRWPPKAAGARLVLLRQLLLTWKDPLSYDLRAEASGRSSSAVCIHGKLARHRVG